MRVLSLLCSFFAPAICHPLPRLMKISSSFFLVLGLMGLAHLAPAQVSTPEVKVEKDVAYLPEGRKEKADLYLPVDDGKQHPAVLIVHGGGWSGGKKDAAREINIGTTLASHGYVCMSIDYLLS